MKNEFLKSKGLKTLSKETQKSINGGFGNFCSLTGCYAA